MAYTRVTATTTHPRGGDIQSVHHTKGSRVRMRKQDATVGAVDIRSLWLPTTVRYGPRTDDVEVRGLSRRYGSTGLSDDFLYDPEKEPEAFDAISALATVQRTLTLCRRSLRRSGRAEPLHWFWGPKPIQLWPRAGDMVNAFYQRDDQSLLFFYFQDKRSGKTVYTCRSWDVVAHETGHAILDALQPQWLLDSIDTLQTGALNESFCDLVAIFGLLEQLDMCELVVAECKGDLSGAANLLSCLGEEFGAACGLPYGIRNAQDDVTMANAPHSIHGLSKVFTGAVYDSLVKFYTSDSNLLLTDPAQTLHCAAMGLLDTLLLAIVESPATRPSFRDVAERMVLIESDKEHKVILTEEFRRRHMFDEESGTRAGRVEAGVEISVRSCSTAAARVAEVPPDRYLCGTLLAAGDDAVKAQLSRSVRVLSVTHQHTCQNGQDERRFAGDRSAIVHVPWHVP